MQWEYHVTVLGVHCIHFDDTIDINFSFGDLGPRMAELNHCEQIN